MIDLRYLSREPAENTWADCLAQYLQHAIDHVRGDQEELWPCDCGSPGDHKEDCAVWDREFDADHLDAQLAELHRLASRASAPCCADPAIWVDGPDSEAARAGRGEGWYDAWLRAPLTPAEQRMVDRVKPGEGLPMPDPDHVPAVCRVGAWEAAHSRWGKKSPPLPKADQVRWAYLDAALALVGRAALRAGDRAFQVRRYFSHGEGRWVPSSRHPRVQRLADALRHRDEEAGHG